MNAPALKEALSRVRGAVLQHKPLELDYELEINGCWTWKVCIEYHREPGTPQVWDCPGTEPSAQIVSIKDRASGKEIMDRIPAELVAALETDLAEGM